MTRGAEKRSFLSDWPTSEGQISAVLTPIEERCGEIFSVSLDLYGSHTFAPCRIQIVFKMIRTSLFFQSGSKGPFTVISHVILKVDRDEICRSLFP